MTKNRHLNVLRGVDIDAADELNQLPRLGTQVGAFGVYCLSDKMQPIELSRISDAQ